jgi:hypothetical protein
MRQFCTQLCPILLTLRLTSAPAHAADSIDLSPRFEPGQTLRVSVDFQAGGNALVRLSGSNPNEGASGSVSGVTGSARDSNKNANNETHLPISVVATLQYDERRLAPFRSATGPASASSSLGATAGGSAPAVAGSSSSALSSGATAGSPSSAALAVRYYNEANATIKVDQGGVAPKLADSRRVIVVEKSNSRPALYSPAGPLPREELDLVDVIGNSAVLDTLLPTKPVAQGDTWLADAAAMAALLTFDTVTVCEMQSVLEEYNAAFAKIRLAGVVEGTADGTPTEQEVRAVYLFDRKHGRITRMNIAAREKRSIGGATPGLDATARLQIKLEPAPADTPLNDTVVATATRARRPANDVLYESPAQGLRLVHDRQWFITSQSREAVTLRRIDQGDVVAQCTITTLPRKAPGQVPLQQFQNDIAQSLGRNFGELVSARQWNSKGYFCYAVTSRGAVESVPIEWHYYLVAHESGQRVSLAVTIEGPNVERLARSDAALVEAIELFPPTPQAAAATTPTLK